MKCNSIDFCLDYRKFMPNFRIPQVFTLIQQQLVIWRLDTKKGSISLEMSLLFVDQPGLEPGTSRL